MTGMAIASMVTAAVAANIAAYSAYQQGKEAKRQANHAANEAEKQARLEQERANIAQIQGEQEAARRMRDYAQEVGSVYAAAAGNGILIDSGSAGDTLGKTLDSSAKFAAKDVSTIRDNTQLTIWTHEQNRDQLLSSAANLRKQGKAAYKAGVLGALASHVSGFADFAGAFSKMGGFDSAMKRNQQTQAGVLSNNQMLKNSGSWQGGDTFFKPNKTMIA